MTEKEFVVLGSGSKMPIFGLGTWKAAPGVVGATVEAAVMECGYRHVDCAMAYRNEAEIGEALTRVWNSGIKREDIFITSKLWNSGHAKEQVRKECENTLRDLRLDYLDLYLMHWGVAVMPVDVSLGNWAGTEFPVNAMEKTAPVSIRDTWEAMEELVTAGLVKNIGVANFTGAMLIDLFSYAKIKPAVNQIELHPYNAQTRLVEFCAKQGVAVTAYSPLGTPGNAKPDAPKLLEDAVVIKIAAAHSKTPAQILLRWAVERGTIVIPKSTRVERLKENFAIFDFELTTTETEAINALERRYRFVDPFDWWQIPYFD